MQINIHRHSEAIYQAAKRQFILMLSAALALGALLLLPALAKAEDNDQIGTNAPHQERSGSATLAPATTTVTATPRTAKKAERRAFVAASTVVVTAQAPASINTPRGTDLPFEALVGTNAPRQERNSAAHPELWSR